MYFKLHFIIILINWNAKYILLFIIKRNIISIWTNKPWFNYMTKLFLNKRIVIVFHNSFHTFLIRLLI